MANEWWNADIQKIEDFDTALGFLKSAQKRTKALSHRCAMLALASYRDHGQTSNLDTLHKELGTHARKNGLVMWIKEFSTAIHDDLRFQLITYKGGKFSQNAAALMSLKDAMEAEDKDAARIAGIGTREKEAGENYFAEYNQVAELREYTTDSMIDRLRSFSKTFRSEKVRLKTTKEQEGLEMGVVAGIMQEVIDDSISVINKRISETVAASQPAA